MNKLGDICITQIGKVLDTGSIHIIYYISKNDIMYSIVDGPIFFNSFYEPLGYMKRLF